MQCCYFVSVILFGMSKNAIYFDMVYHTTCMCFSSQMFPQTSAIFYLFFVLVKGLLWLVFFVLVIHVSLTIFVWFYFPAILIKLCLSLVPYFYDVHTVGRNLGICHVFADSIVFKQLIYFSFLQMVGIGGSQN